MEKRMNKRIDQKLSSTDQELDEIGDLQLRVYKIVIAYVNHRVFLIGFQ